jgi:uncharacterized membrane protein YbhN (UPF0104 family)
LTSRRQAQAAGVLVGLATVALVGYLIGFTDITAAIRTLSARQTLALVGVGLVPLGLWGVSLWLALGAVDAATSLPRAVLLFCVSLFFNSLTPFGQTGGTPLSGGVIAHAVQTPYERALAALGGLNALNALATGGLWVLGGALLAAGGEGAGARNAVLVAGTGVAGTVLLLVVGWRVRWTLADRLSGVTVSALTRAGQFVPRWSPPPAAAVAARVDGFVEAVEQLAASRRRFAGIACLVVAGQLTVVFVLYIALGFFSDPRLGAVLFVVPLSRTAAAVPTPGGIGSTEALLTSLLVTVVGTTPAAAGAATVLYRVTAFWIPALIGGAGAAGLLLESRR